jgi:hypothetical protein
MDKTGRIIKISMNFKLLLVFSIVATILFSGCTTNQSPIDGIVGKWSVVSPFSEIAVLEEFYDNGIVVMGANTPFSQDGTYKFTDDKHLIIRFGGLGDIAGDQHFEVVSFSDDKMVLKDSSGNLWTYTKM